jgi:hypothetical protein
MPEINDCHFLWRLECQNNGVNQSKYSLSLLTSNLSSLSAIAAGTPLAYILARWNFNGKTAFELLIDLPIVLPPSVAGLALLIAFGRQGVFEAWLSAIGITLPFITAAVMVTNEWQVFRFIMFRSPKLTHVYTEADGCSVPASTRTAWKPGLTLSPQAYLSGELPVVNRSRLRAAFRSRSIVRPQ